MPDLSRSQVIVYGAAALALLFVGARAIKAEGSSGGSSYSASSGGSYSSSGGSPSSSSSSEGFSVSSSSGGDVVVDVTGAVARPGVYRLPSGSRVNDAVKRAGGATGKARLEAVNLAARLADGQQVVVPEAGVAGAAVTAAGASGGEEAGPISLGTATAAQLDTIDGIGPVTAQKIVEFREGQGGLSSVDQLDQISGIGPATMQSLRARLQP